MQDDKDRLTQLTSEQNMLLNRLMLKMVNSMPATPSASSTS